MRDTTFEEIVAREAAHDAAFDAGLVEAWKRGSGLMFVKTRVAGVAAWLAAYPEGTLTIEKAAKWARSHGLALDEGDVYLTPAKVRELYSLTG